ncbi:GxxExxY protein [Thiomicrospira sp.]|uniref:GxxExxY protein n=1 Tax=Thiomicrospira sp. TaxID=935 RepID=UPI002F92DB31
MEFDALSNQVIGLAIEVHRELGPGLLESTYEKCFSLELRKAGIPHNLQKLLPITYKGTQIDDSLRIDLLVADSLIVELKSSDRLHPIHDSSNIDLYEIGQYKTRLID